MPSFTLEVPNLWINGPVFEVRVAVGSAVEAALRTANAPVPPPVTALALIDTGATRSVIRQGVATQLGLNPVGVTYINTPSSMNVPCSDYLIRLLFPNNVVFETTAIEAPLQGQPIECLMGRDVLSRAVLVYIGYRNLFSLSF